MTTRDCMNQQECVEFLLRLDLGTLVEACAVAVVMSETPPLTPRRQAIWDLCETVLHFRIEERE
jgi:hypothetical protein